MQKTMKEQAKAEEQEEEFFNEFGDAKEEKSPYKRKGWAMNIGFDKQEKKKSLLDDEDSEQESEEVVASKEEKREEAVAAKEEEST